MLRSCPAPRLGTSHSSSVAKPDEVGTPLDLKKAFFSPPRSYKIMKRFRRWLFIRLIAAAFGGILLYLVPSLFLELAFFPAHGAMMPRGIHETTVPPPELTTPEPLKRFPKRIHVTYKSIAELPEDWKLSLGEWERIHPDWDVKFWSDSDIEDFVDTEYPHMKQVFDKYQYQIQKVDAVRYMILSKFGGIYSDLDIFPHRNLQDLLAYVETTGKDVMLSKTLNFGVTNAFMASVPSSPFMQCVIENLPHYQQRFHHAIGWRHWQVLSSAGSTFLWGMLGHCGSNNVMVLSTESFRRCSVCDTWGSSSLPDENWCDTDWLKHASTNSSWHQTKSWFHQVWFGVAMSLSCYPFRACISISFILILAVPKCFAKPKRSSSLPLRVGDTTYKNSKKPNQD